MKRVLNISIYIIMLCNFSIITTFAETFDYGYTKEDFKCVKHAHSEASYQHAWCKANNGFEEYENSDKTRVDCLTSTHAVEFDFANKWAGSIEQALHYQLMTGKRAKVVLILENPKAQMVYFNRVKKLGEVHNFDMEFITPEILMLDENGKCKNNECKCRKNPDF